MKIVVTGSTGLVGSALVPFLEGHGHQVIRLRRGMPDAGTTDAVWDPAHGVLLPNAVEGADGIVHLSGAGIADRRWTAARKRVLRDSRIQTTRLLCETLAGLSPPPRAVAVASAVGFYGDRGDDALDESAGPGRGFLAELARDWESAADPARECGIRVTHVRTGIVLSPSGGALGKMLPAFKLGVGGMLGSGRQHMSWIALDDLLGAVWQCLADERLQGPVNAVSPRPVTNREFTKTLGRVLRRPTVFPVPAPAIRLLFGEMGDEALLSSTRVTPGRLEASGFAFRYPVLEGALRHVLGREA